MQSEKAPPANFPRPVLPSLPSIRVQFRAGRKIETTFDSQGRPVERQTTQLDASKYPSPAQFLPESPLRQ